MSGATGVSDVGEPAPRALPVTVVIPVRNDDQNLRRCLACVAAHFTRVIVVDSSHTASTEAIAAEVGADYVVFQWNGRYPKKRNWALQTQGIDSPWVLFLDADEFVTPAFVAELCRELPGSGHDGYWIRYTNHFLGRLLRHGPPMRKLALLRVGAGYYERIDEDAWSSLDMEVHEHPVLAGTTGEVQAPVDHDDFSGLHNYIGRHNDYSSWEAARFAMLAHTPEAWEHFTAPQRRKYSSLDRWWLAPSYFLYSYVWKRGFLDGGAGFAFAFLKAVYFFQIRLKIQEGRRRERGHRDA